MRRSYKFLLRPTSAQAAALTACLEDHRQLYNAALEERREAWRMRRTPVSYYVQAVQLTAIRCADRDGQGRWSAGSQQQTLRRLDKAFAAYFRRVKTGQKPGYPRFKGRGWFNTIEWPAQRNGARWDSAPHPVVTRVYLLGIGHVRVHRHRAVVGRVKTIGVKREGSRWYVVLSCDNVPTRPLPPTGAATGIDLGVASFLTTSEGVHVPNPRHLAESARKLAAAQRDLTRKRCGSKRRRKDATRVAAMHGKVQRARLDHARKTKTGPRTRRDLPRGAEDREHDPQASPPPYR